MSSSRLIKLLGLIGLIPVGLATTIIVLAGAPAERAVIGMAWGLIVLWIGIGGTLMWRYRDRVRAGVLGIPMGWQVKFVLLATILALVEEAVTTTMTNLAPVFGVKVGEAYITASANYLDVVLGHSVIVFAPMFVGWAWLLGRYNFSPNAVFLLFGLTGTLAETTSFGLDNLLNVGFWVFVYGLMVYLPAYSLPPERGAKPPRAIHYPLAVMAPFLFAIPVAAVVGLLHPTKIHFPPIQ